MLTYSTEPVWRRKSQLRKALIPNTVADWLFDSGSLTGRIVEACDGRFRVEVLQQGWQVPMRNESQRLGIRNGRIALVREVYLYCNDTPWVFARTVIPRSTLTGTQRYLAHLGNKPLGAALFSDPSMERDELEVSCLAAGQSLFATATQKMRDIPACIWGRRSIFRVGDKPLLVAEIFLPTLPTCRG